MQLPMIGLTLLSRSYCHLCDEMASKVAPLLAAFDASLQVIDIDQHPHLEAQYGECVPVLLHGEVVLSSFVLDAEKVRRYLSPRKC